MSDEADLSYEELAAKMELEEAEREAQMLAETQVNGSKMEDNVPETPQATLEGENTSFHGSDTLGLASRYTRETPISILVGPKKTQYFVHRGLLAAKSPFLRTMFKDCWDGKKEEVELIAISNQAFDIVIDWMYSGKLNPKAMAYPQSRAMVLRNTLSAYTAAHMLMMSKLQNELILNEAAYLLSAKAALTVNQLKVLYNTGLCHTKLYAFSLRSVTVNIMQRQYYPEKWNQAMALVKDDPQILADLLTCVREWQHKPWPDFLKGDLTEYLINDAEV